MWIEAPVEPNIWLSPLLDRTAVSGPGRDRGRPEPEMSLPQSVADVIRDHVTLEVEGIDRM